MRKFTVTFEVFLESGKKFLKSLTVEAGNKKLAGIRAMGEINKDEQCSGLYKNLKSIEEVA